VVVPLLVRKVQKEEALREGEGGRGGRAGDRSVSFR